MLARLLILFLILGGQAAYAQSPKAPMPIYGDRLAPGWDNWSWAKVELSAKLSPTATTTPIKVDAGPWAAVFLHHAVEAGLDMAPPAAGSGRARRPTPGRRTVGNAWSRRGSSSWATRAWPP